MQNLLYEMISAEAQKLLEDLDILANEYRHTCHMIENAVTRPYNIACASENVAPVYSFYDEISKLACEFIQTVLNDRVGVLGFELSDEGYQDLTKIHQCQYPGAFVHRIASYNPEREVDLVRFIATRKAWLKFLTQIV